MLQPTLDDAKALVRGLRHRDLMLLIPWMVASFDSTGAERQPGFDRALQTPEVLQESRSEAERAVIPTLIDAEAQCAFATKARGKRCPGRPEKLRRVPTRAKFRCH